MSNELIEKCINQLSDYEAAQPIKQLQIIDNLEDEFNKYNNITATVSNIKNFASQFAFKEISEYYEEVNGYEYLDNYSGLSLYIESHFNRNSNYNDEIDIKISIQGKNDNNKHLFDRFMYGSILILENFIK